MPTPRLLPLVLGLLTVAGGAASADPSPEAIPETRPIQLDGAPVKAEWSAAKAFPLGAEGSELLLQQFRGTLMLAVRSDRTWTPRSALALYLCPDGPKAGAGAPGAVRIQYKPFEHNRAHAIVWRKGAQDWQRLHDSVVVRHTIRPGATALEMAIPLSVLGLTKDQRPALRACCAWSRMGATSLVWPQGLDLRGAAGKQPPDLVSARRWALLGGWGDPSAPGAFSKSDWTAWTTLDRQIRAKGTAAHQAAGLLTEEWKKTKKRDEELVPEVLGALRWIGQHERLTANDLLAMTTVLRYLNRHQEALGLLAALVNYPDEAEARRAYRERALLFQSLQRYDDAAADWAHLARVSQKPWGAAYTRAAKTCRTNAAAWAEEAAARKADETNPKLPRVALHTNHGVIEVVLYADDVPAAVKHFLELVGSKFYDGTLFHRVKGEFLAQGGDPKSRDQGLEFAGSGTSPKLVPVEQNKRHTFWRGALGFARGISDYNGSQFFLMTGPRPKLGNYTCFGHIVRGQAVADRLEYGDTLTRAVVLSR